MYLPDVSCGRLGTSGCNRRVKAMSKQMADMDYIAEPVRVSDTIRLGYRHVYGTDDDGKVEEMVDMIGDDGNIIYTMSQDDYTGLGEEIVSGMIQMAKDYKQ